MLLPEGGPVSNNSTRMEISWLLSFQLLNAFESINVNIVCLQNKFLVFVIFCLHRYFKLLSLGFLYNVILK